MHTVDCKHFRCATDEWRWKIIDNFAVFFFDFFFGFWFFSEWSIFSSSLRLLSLFFFVPSNRYSKLKHNLQYFAAHSLINIKIRDNMRKSYEHHDLCWYFLPFSSFVMFFFLHFLVLFILFFCLTDNIFDRACFSVHNLMNVCRFFFLWIFNIILMMMLAGL